MSSVVQHSIMQGTSGQPDPAAPTRPRSHLIGAPEPAPKWVPSPAQFDTLRALIKSVLRASSVSISFDGTDLLRTSGVQTGFMGVPLVRKGELLGALRVLDSAGRVFTDEERALLERFAALVVDQFELWQQASRDPLTGAMSRRAFMNDLSKVLAACQRTGDDASVILIDLDHFKKVNDTHGHAAGDAVLTAMAQVIAAELRAYDTFGRLGGEEFGIIVGLPLAGALDVAERARSAIARAVVPGHPSLEVTASFGVAEWTPECAGAEVLLQAADAQLYLAKQTGRNRVQSALGPRPLTLVG